MVYPKQNKRSHPKGRSNKIHLVFDATKRREFLTGFHKRKLQRKKEAKEKLEQQLKIERKRLKAEAKESYKKLVVSSRPIPGLEHLLEDQYEDEDVTVKIVELSVNDIAEKNNWIGANIQKYEEPPVEESPDEIEEEVPGMELQQSKAKKENKTPELTTKKDVQKLLKKKATKNVQNSKAFQRKNKIESLKQRKKSMHQKKERIKLYKKRDKHRGRRSETN